MKIRFAVAQNLLERVSRTMLGVPYIIPRCEDLADQTFKNTLCNVRKHGNLAFIYGNCSNSWREPLDLC